MKIKEIYLRFFLLNTSRTGTKPTRGFSSLESGFILLICTILKKIIFPDLHISLLLLFQFFLFFASHLSISITKFIKEKTKSLQ